MLGTFLPSIPWLCGLFGSALGMLLSLVSGCASPPQSLALAPSATPFTLNPSQSSAVPPDAGSDAGAPDPSGHRQALQSALESSWGWRNDKDDQVHAPLLDWRRWERVQYWGVEHLTGFRYGPAHDALTIAIPVVLPPDTAPTSAVCMGAFEDGARPLVRQYEVVLGPMRTRRTTWRGQRLLIKWADGHVDFAFQRREFSAAWAAYPAYVDSCLVYAVSVQWKGERGLAQQLRDRFVAEAFERMQTLTELRPDSH